MPTREPKFPRTPVIVVSGFLGSGKTSLVRHLLRDAQASGSRVAVVSNEFGELGIDRALLGGGGQAFVELDGGCVCCQLTDELVETLESLRREVRPDRVVIETSGVALPYDTQLNLYREPVSRWVGEDIAVVVVGAEQLAAGRDLTQTFEDQVTSADYLVLNKLDLVDAGRVEALEARLREIEPEAPIVRAVRGRVDPRLLFVPRPRPERGGPDPRREHSHEDFASRELEVPPGIDPERLESALLRGRALRAKGFVELDGGVRLVQLVGPRFELLDPPDDLDPGLVGRVVVIGREPLRVSLAGEDDA
ncbi:MAG: GTP-binding protein [Proteobacteria bacterium]|nr:GTP-binding protein [Pseudomonadota bacterium]